MNVNSNVTSSANSNKLYIPKQPNRKEEFKKVLSNQELNSKKSSNENAYKKYNKDENSDKVNSKNPDKLNDQNQSEDDYKTTVEGSTAKDLNNSKDDKELKVKIINFIETAIDVLKQKAEEPSKELEGADKSTEEMAQIQQLLQLLSSMLQSVDETPATNNGEMELISNNTEKLLGRENLTPDTKNMLKNNLSEIVALLGKSKENNKTNSQIISVLQNLTTEVEKIKGDLNLLKGNSFQIVSGNNEEQSIKDNLLKKVIEQSTKTASEIIPKNQMQSSKDSSKENKSSGNSSFEEKFLNSLLSEDKDETKISKAVNFMNQFESAKTVDTAKVQTVNLVIDKNSFDVDVIKTIKFMDINNIKELTVKMNPKDLGELTVKITMESGIMKASISALNKDAYNLLNNNIQDISDKLKNMDIKIQSLDINIYEDSTFFSKDSNGSNNKGNEKNSSRANIVLEEEDIPISNNYGLEEGQVNKFV